MDGCHIIIHRSEDILTWTQKKKAFFYMNNFEDETWKLKHIFLPLCTKPDIITPWMGVNYNKNFIIQISNSNFRAIQWVGLDPLTGWSPELQYLYQCQTTWIQAATIWTYRLKRQIYLDMLDSTTQNKTMQTSHFYEYFLIKTKNKEALQ